MNTQVPSMPELSAPKRPWYRWRWWMRPIVVCAATPVVVGPLIMLSTASTDLSAFLFFILLAVLAMLLLHAPSYVGGTIGGIAGFAIGVLIPTCIFLSIAWKYWASEDNPDAFVIYHGLFTAIAASLVTLIIYFFQKLPSIGALAANIILLTVGCGGVAIADGFSALGVITLTFVGAAFGLLVTPARPGTGLAEWRRRPIAERVPWRFAYVSPADRAIAESGLPDAIRELIARTVSRTKLRLHERESVAKELIAHFADGLAAGTSPADLARDFGDPRRTAALVRRSKRRCRGWNDRLLTYLNRGLFACAGLLIAAYLWQGVRFWTAEPNIAVNYVELLQAPIDAIPEEDKSWREWCALWAEMPLEEDLVFYEGPHLPGMEEEGLFGTVTLSIDEYGRAHAERWGLEDAWDAMYADLAPWNAKARELARSKPAFGWPHAAGDWRQPEEWFEVQRARAGDDWVRPEPPSADEREIWDHENWLISLILPYITEQRRTLKRLRIDVERAAAQGDTERFVENVEAMTAICLHAGEAPILVNGLTSAAILARTQDAVLHVLARQPDLLNEQEASAVGMAFERVALDIAEYLDSEKMMMLDTIQRVYSDDGNGNGRVTLEGLRLLEQLIRAFGVDDGPRGVSSPAFYALGPIATTGMVSRAEAVQRSQAYYRLIESHAALPAWDRADSAIQEQVNSFGVLDESDYNAFSAGFLPRDPVNAWIMPAITQSVSYFEQISTGRDATIVTLALCAYYNEHGVWPASLDEIVGDGMLPAVPRDPYDGEPLRYRLTDAGPVLYSIGVDGDDDGGVWPEGSDWSLTGNRPGSATKNRLGIDGDWVLFRLGSIEPER